MNGTKSPLPLKARLDYTSSSLIKNYCCRPCCCEHHAAYNGTNQLLFLKPKSDHLEHYRHRPLSHGHHHHLQRRCYGQHQCRCHRSRCRHHHQSLMPPQSMSSSSSLYHYHCHQAVPLCLHLSLSNHQGVPINELSFFAISSFCIAQCRLPFVFLIFPREDLLYEAINALCCVREILNFDVWT